MPTKPARIAPRAAWAITESRMAQTASCCVTRVPMPSSASPVRRSATRSLASGSGCRACRPATACPWPPSSDGVRGISIGSPSVSPAIAPCGCRPCVSALASPSPSVPRCPCWAFKSPLGRRCRFAPRSRATQPSRCGHASGPPAAPSLPDGSWCGAARERHSRLPAGSVSVSHCRATPHACPLRSPSTACRYVRSRVEDPRRLRSDE